MSTNKCIPLNSITEDNLARRFTNRDYLIRQFCESLNNDPAPKNILFFHGDGGNGKSLLLKFLREAHCKRVTSTNVWEQISDLPKHMFAGAFRSVRVKFYTPVPATILDFGQQPLGEDKPQDPFYGLLMLRRKVAIAATELKCRLKFPLYDFACVWYLYKKGKSSEEIKRLFPLSEVAGLIAPLLDSVNQTSVASIGKAVLDIFAKDLGHRFNLYLQKRALTAVQVENICKKDLDTALINTLPHWFAQDLNAAIKQENSLQRLVLFFDSHEAFWGHQRNLPDYTFFQKDEWLRRLLSSLELSQGIVVVVAGREAPRWTDAPEPTIVHNYLNMKVGHLSATNAKVYLQNAEISETHLTQAVIEYASITPDQVHPFYLGLCADVVRTAKQRGTILSSTDFATIPEIAAKSKVLINRLLQYANKEIEYAIHALSACRNFDFDLYFKLGQALHFEATKPAFDILAGFSFVWQNQPKHDNWYRIHDLLRRLYHELGNATTHDAHVILEQHYREQGNVAEAIYHAICHHRLRGMKELLKVFNQAKQQGDLELCRLLLKIRTEASLYSDKSHNQ
jgi:hypothetical protein